MNDNNAFLRAFRADHTAIAAAQRHHPKIVIEIDPDGKVHSIHGPHAINVLTRALPALRNLCDSTTEY